MYEDVKQVFSSHHRASDRIWVGSGKDLTKLGPDTKAPPAPELSLRRQTNYQKADSDHANETTRKKPYSRRRRPGRMHFKGGFHHLERDLSQS